MCCILNGCLAKLYSPFSYSKISIYLSNFPPIHLSTSIPLSDHPSIHPPYLPCYLCIHFSIFLSIRLSVYPSVCPSIFPSIHQPTHSILSICLSIHLSVCLSQGKVISETLLLTQRRASEVLHKVKRSEIVEENKKGEIKKHARTKSKSFPFYFSFLLSV